MKRQQFILIFLFVITAGAATILLKDVVVTYVLIPIEQVVWAVSILFETIPEVVWWGIFILVLFVTLLEQFAGTSSNLKTAVTYPNKHPGRLFPWVKLPLFSSVNSFQRWKLIRRVSELAIEILAEENRTSIEYTRQYILEGKTELPTEVLRFIQSGLSPDWYNPTRKTIRFFSRKRLSPRPDIGIEQILDFLETKRI